MIVGATCVVPTAPDDLAIQSGVGHEQRNMAVSGAKPPCSMSLAVLSCRSRRVGLTMMSGVRPSAGLPNCLAPAQSITAPPLSAQTPSPLTPQFACRIHHRTGGVCLQQLTARSRWLWSRRPDEGNVVRGRLP